jgi:prepilin-type N-terminal cleavage/methylation domain-containing protein
MSSQQNHRSATNGFTLIELLIGITLSAILMTGVLVFVSNSLGSNLENRQRLEESNKNESFEQHLRDILADANGASIYASGTAFWSSYGTGVFLATPNNSFPITFFGLKTQTGYCDSYSGAESETGAITRLSLRQFSVPKIENNAPGYILSNTGNSVYSGSTLIVWTQFRGSDLNINSGALTELSSPSSLVSTASNLYIADTMNDRVLSYNIASKIITKILGRENGIRQPTSLYLSGNTLLVASSGNGIIYSLQDGIGDGSSFSNTFRVASNFSANTITFTFPSIPAIGSPVGPGNFTFSGGTLSQVPLNDIVSADSNLQYTFSGGLQIFSTGSLYQFYINNIAPAPTTPGNHIVNVDFLSGSIVVYSDTFHYFTKWDNSLESGSGNVIQTLSSGSVYPHSITSANSWSGAIDWSAILSENPPGEEMLSSPPIQDLSFTITGKILTIRYNEYTNYDCLLGKHTIEEKIQKILLP